MHLICQRKLNSYYAHDKHPFGEDITWADNKMNNKRWITKPHLQLYDNPIEQHTGYQNCQRVLVCFLFFIKPKKDD